MRPAPISAADQPQRGALVLWRLSLVSMTCSVWAVLRSLAGRINWALCPALPSPARGDLRDQVVHPCGWVGFRSWQQGGVGAGEGNRQVGRSLGCCRGQSSRVELTAPSGFGL